MGVWIDEEIGDKENYSKMKIAVLCAGRIGMPALQKLLEQGKVAAIGVPESKTEIVQVCRYLAKKFNITLQIFSGKGFGIQLLGWLEQTAPEVVFVLTFPHRIPEAALSIPKHGFINFHYGLLPQMRGADPIFESIRLRKATAGVTVHLMDAGFDTGPVISREEMPLPVHFTYGMLSAQLAFKGEEMCRKLVSDLEEKDRVETTPQDESLANYYPKLSESGISLQWETMDSTELIALINACNPSSKNGVPASVNGWTIGVCFAVPVALSGDLSAYLPGQILVADQQNGLLVLTKDQVALRLDIVYTEEGYFPGYVLTAFGIAAGMRFVEVINA
jgi:methionyl-tRNA formyltransferase